MFFFLQCGHSARIVLTYEFSSVRHNKFRATSNCTGDELDLPDVGTLTDAELSKSLEAASLDIFEKESSPLTPEESVWIEKFQKDLNSSRNLASCDCSFNVTDINIQGSLEFPNEEAIISIATTGPPLCGTNCPAVAIQATTNLSNQCPPTGSCFLDASLDIISGSMSPNSQPFNCNLSHGQSIEFAGNFFARFNSNCFTTFQNQAVAIVSIQVLCHDDNPPGLQAIYEDNINLFIPAGMDDGRIRMAVDSNCQPFFIN